MIRKNKIKSYNTEILKENINSKNSSQVKLMAVQGTKTIFNAQRHLKL